MGIFSKISGLDDISKIYGIDEPIKEPYLKKQTVKIGKVRYRRCVNVSFHHEELNLEIKPPLGKKTRLKIPWSDMIKYENDTLYSLKAIKILFNSKVEFDLTIYENLFVKMKPYLPK